MKIEDVRIDTFRTGIGLRATTSVRVTHMPTGLTESIETVHSEHTAKKQILARLRERVQKAEFEATQKEAK